MSRHLRAFSIALIADIHAGAGTREYTYADLAARLDEKRQRDAAGVFAKDAAVAAEFNQ